MKRSGGHETPRARSPETLSHTISFGYYAGTLHSRAHMLLRVRFLLSAFALTTVPLQKEVVVRARTFACAAIAACLAIAAAERPSAAVGKPGVTPVPCPQQEWQLADATFEALPGAKAFFGKYDGGLYRIEIPETRNGELVLFAHGFVPAAGPNGSTLRVG